MIPIILTKKEKLALGLMFLPVGIYFASLYLVARLLNK